MLYTAWLAVCLSSTPVERCNGSTAVDWFMAPEPQLGLSMCTLHGQQYAAASGLVGAGTYLKVFCRPVVTPPGVG